MPSFIAGSEILNPAIFNSFVERLGRTFQTWALLQGSYCG